MDKTKIKVKSKGRKSVGCFKISCLFPFQKKSKEAECSEYAKTEQVCDATADSTSTQSTQPTQKKIIKRIALTCTVTHLSTICEDTEETDFQHNAKLRQISFPKKIRKNSIRQNGVLPLHSSLKFIIHEHATKGTFGAAEKKIGQCREVSDYYSRHNIEYDPEEKTPERLPEIMARCRAFENKLHEGKLKWEKNEEAMREAREKSKWQREKNQEQAEKACLEDEA